MPERQVESQKPHRGMSIREIEEQNDAEIAKMDFTDTELPLTEREKANPAVVRKWEGAPDVVYTQLKLTARPTDLAHAIRDMQVPARFRIRGTTYTITRRDQVDHFVEGFFLRGYVNEARGKEPESPIC